MQYTVCLFFRRDNRQNWLFRSCYNMGPNIPASTKFPKDFQNPSGLKTQNVILTLFFFFATYIQSMTNSCRFLFQNASFIYPIVFLCIVIRKTQTLLTLQIRHCQTLLSGLSFSNLSLPLRNCQQVDIHKMLSGPAEELQCVLINSCTWT